VAAPGDADLTSWRRVSGNLIVHPYVPQLELFPRVSVFITHGGMSSVQEALSFGVPFVVFPQTVEQSATARRIAELGVGVVLSGDGFTGSDLRAALERVMADPAFRQDSLKMRTSLGAAGGYQRAADVIQTFVQRGRLAHPEADGRLVQVFPD
jgi:MGT family glycosyltransferase